MIFNGILTNLAAPEDRRILDNERNHRAGYSRICFFLVKNTILIENSDHLHHRLHCLVWADAQRRYTV